MAFHQGVGYVFDRDQFGGFLDMIVERVERVTTLEFDLFGLEEGGSETVQALENKLSDWLCDLTSTNIEGDGVTTVEREWYILYVFHRTPGHIVICLDLFSEDLSERIQYPFKEPENWKNRPLRRANWKETRINLYNELVIKTQELEAQGLYSKKHVKTH